MTEILQWDPSFDIGVTEMNDEHKKLIALMNQLHHEHNQGEPKATLARTVDELVAYTLTHFRDEEALMEKVRYPKLETHKIIHKNLVKSLQGHIDGFHQTGALTAEFFEFLQFWLSAHIRGIDMQYGDHCRSGRAA